MLKKKVKIFPSRIPTEKMRKESRKKPTVRFRTPDACPFCIQDKSPDIQDKSPDIQDKSPDIQDKSPDYKDYNALKAYVSDRAKILGRVRTGVCARHQKKLSTAVKRARYLGLLPYTPTV